MMDSVASIETPDEHTVVAKLNASNSEFLGVLTAPYTGVINSDVAIANKANANQDADSTDQAEPWFLANSAGSGPFVLDSYKPDDELRLKRNDAYWGTKPAAGEIVIRETKDAVSQAQMVESGDADIAMQIDPDTAKNVTSPDVTIETVPSFNFVYVALSPGAKGLPHPLTPKIREAIAHAIDYDGVIELTVGGAGKRQASPIPNGFPGSEGLTPVAYDVDLAKKMMAEEGVADGFTLQAIFPNVNQYGVDFTVMMQKVQQDLAEINVTLELQPVEFSVWRQHINGDGIPLTAVFFAPDYFGSSQYPLYFAMMEGTAWSKRAGAKNDPSVLNPAEAEALKLALATGGEESAKHFNEVAEMMMKDFVILPLVSPDLVLAYRKDVTGVRYSACCNLPTADLARK
jgi:peptide/nickel transport system substrate-binding protein